MTSYQKEYHRKWYDKHKKERRERVQKRKKGIREWFRELKEGLHCEVCGISGKDQAWVLEFHHIEPATKKEGISYLVSHGYGKKRILAGIKKCAVICANCHRAEHYQEFMEARRKGTHDDIWTRSGEGRIRRSVYAPQYEGKGRQAKRRRERRLRKKRRGIVRTIASQVRIRNLKTTLTLFSNESRQGINWMRLIWRLSADSQQGTILMPPAELPNGMKKSDLDYSRSARRPFIEADNRDTASKGSKVLRFRYPY